MSFQVKPQTNARKDNESIYVSTKLKGARAEAFEKMAAENGLSRSALLAQIISHCLGVSDDTEEGSNAEQAL